MTTIQRNYCITLPFTAGWHDARLSYCNVGCIQMCYFYLIVYSFTQAEGVQIECVWLLRHFIIEIFVLFFVVLIEIKYVILLMLATIHFFLIVSSAFGGSDCFLRAVASVIVFFSSPVFASCGRQELQYGFRRRVCDILDTTPWPCYSLV